MTSCHALPATRPIGILSIKYITRVEISRNPGSQRLCYVRYSPLHWNPEGRPQFQPIHWPGTKCGDALRYFRFADPRYVRPSGSADRICLGRLHFYNAALRADGTNLSRTMHVRAGLLCGGAKSQQPARLTSLVSYDRMECFARAKGGSADRR